MFVPSVRLNDFNHLLVCLARFQLHVVQEIVVHEETNSLREIRYGHTYFREEQLFEKSVSILFIFNPNTQMHVHSATKMDVLQKDFVEVALAEVAGACASDDFLPQGHEGHDLKGSRWNQVLLL